MTQKESGITNYQKYNLWAYGVVLSILFLSLVKKINLFNLKTNTIPLLFHAVLLILVFGLSMFLLLWVYKNHTKSNLTRSSVAGLSFFMAVFIWCLYAGNLIFMRFDVFTVINWIVIALWFFVICSFLGLILIKLDKNKFTILLNILIIVALVFILYLGFSAFVSV